eukprot:339966-Pyramimonas_sp.AAC.1
MQMLVGGPVRLRHGLSGRALPRGHHPHIQGPSASLGERLGGNVIAPGKPVERLHAVVRSQSSA